MTLSLCKSKVLEKYQLPKLKAVWKQNCQFLYNKTEKLFKGILPNIVTTCADQFLGF